MFYKVYYSTGSMGKCEKNEKSRVLTILMSFQHHFAHGFAKPFLTIFIKKLAKSVKIFSTWNFFRS